MKTIGLLGGMSWQSAIPYYRHINEAVQNRPGGLHSARILLHSVDFHDIARLMEEDRWAEAAQVLANAAVGLCNAGADCIVICTNTMHAVAPAIEQALPVPLLHIADATAAAIHRNGIETVGLLGTRFTMEKDFYRNRLRDNHNILALVPEAEDRAEIHRIIFEELCQGVILASSRHTFNGIIARLIERGAQGMILGCTEFSLLIDPAGVPVPAFDTTELHALYAVDFALTPLAKTNAGGNP